MNWMHINDFGDWECQYCCTSALMIESVSHWPDCPVVLAGGSPTLVAADLPYMCSECGAHRAEFDPCPSCGAA
jgi:hypothetical protein